MAGINGDAYLENQIEELSKALNKEYKKAYKEMKKRADEYFKTFMAEDKVMKKRLNAGEITATEYTNWKQRKILQTTRYHKMVNKLAKDLTKTDVIARNTITAGLPQTFIESANIEAYVLHRLTGDVFTVYNQDAVGALIDSKELYLPPKMDIEKAQRWNVQRIHSAIVQGILQGDTLVDLSSRLYRVADMNASQAKRTARTMHTASANAGRLNSMKRAQAMGSNIKKQWLSAHDERTRDAHRELDREIQELDKPFVNSLGAIMFPSDPTASPANTYNCRCALRRVLKNHPYPTDPYMETEDYEAWKKGEKYYKQYKKDKEG